MKQYSEALEILNEKYSFSTSLDIMDLKKDLNLKLEEQNEMMKSK